MSSGVYKCQLLNKWTLLNELFLLNWPTGPIQSQSLDVCLLIYIYINCKFDYPKIGFCWALIKCAQLSHNMPKVLSKAA